MTSQTKTKGRQWTPASPRPLPASLRACADPTPRPARGQPTASFRAAGALPPGSGARAQRRRPRPPCGQCLPATGVCSFRPGKASWGLTMFEAELPILWTGKRLWRRRWSCQALRVAESMGGRQPKGGPGGRRYRQRSRSRNGREWGPRPEPGGGRGAGGRARGAAGGAGGRP